MKPPATERWEQTQEIFDTAIELSGAEREAFLDEATAADHTLRAEIEGLLSADETAGDFLEMAVRDASLDFVGATEPDEVSHFGKYELTGWIGEGGFGQVHRGRDPVLQREVAIKTCSSGDPEVRERFLREAKIAGSLQHPNIVTVHDIGFERRVSFIVQELLSGEDLARKIASKEEITFEGKLDYLIQIARGVDFAHRNGVLHRDIKPSNVQILSNGRAKILDFGIARLIDDDSRLTSIGAAMGTAGYQAPELLQGGEIDAQSDVFSFGVLAYELLSGQRPFAGKTFSEVSYRVLKDRPLALGKIAPEVPAAVERLVMSCLDRKKSRRPASFGAIRSDLEAIAAGRAAVLTRPRRQRATALALAATGALALVGGVWIVRSLWDASAEVTSPSGAVLQVENHRPRLAADLAMLTADSPAAGWAAVPALDEAGDAAVVQAVADLSNSPLGRQPVDDPVALRGDSDALRGVSDPLSSSGIPAGTARTGLSEPTDENRSESTPELTTKRGEGELGLASVTPSENPDTDESLRDTTGGLRPGSGRPLGLPESPDRELDSAPETVAAGDIDGSSVDGSAAGGAQQLPPLPQVEVGPTTSEQLVSEPDIVYKPRYPPRLIDEPVVLYPPIRRPEQFNVSVIVAVLVDETGQVVRTNIQKSNDQGLGFDERAIEAALSARYQPGRVGDRPTKMWATLVIRFY